MDVLKVEFQPQDGLERVDTFRSRMGASVRFVIVQLLDMSVNMSFPLLLVEELLHPYGSGKCLIPQTERTIPRAGKGSTIDERIALNGKRFRLPQVVLTVTVPFIFAENPFAAVEAQLGKAAGGQEFLFVAAIDVSPSLGRWFAMGTDSGQLLASRQEEGDMTNRSGSSLCSAIRQLHLSGSRPGRKGTSASC